MSLQLRPDELLVALQRLNHPQFPSFLDQLLSLCDDMAEAIVEHTPNVKANIHASFWGEMVCTPIAPIDDTQPIPEHLQGFDDEGW